MKLLFVDCCISQRGDRSRTRALCDAFLREYQGAHPAAEIELADLRRMDLKPFDQIMLDERDALASVKAFDAPVFQLARQFRAADHILVGAPFWDLTFPALLRIYIEHVSVVGLTYHYEADGCHGDCGASRLAYLSSGGDAEQPGSLGVAHWRQLSGMFGIPQFDYVFAGGLDLGDGRAEEIMSAACERAGQLGRAC